MRNELKCTMNIEQPMIFTIHAKNIEMNRVLFKCVESVSPFLECYWKDSGSEGEVEREKER